MLYTGNMYVHVLYIIISNICTVCVPSIYMQGPAQSSQLFIYARNTYIGDHIGRKAAVAITTIVKVHCNLPMYRTHNHSYNLSTNHQLT